jgi:Carboxypeptidase regulatory-like domain/TonB dependent receptor
VTVCRRLDVLDAAAALVLLLLTLAAPLAAQQFSGTIQGIVVDTSGALVPGATVAVIAAETNDARTIATDANGRYVVPQLKPGFYRITVAKDGFKSATLENVKLDVQQMRSVDVTLDVGPAIESVTVVGRPAVVETTSSTISQTIENKRLVDLPLNGRNPFSLAVLAPGVVPAAGSSPFISGGRNATSEVTIDGVSNVNAENNVSILDLNYTPSVDAVQELSVQTNAVSAEFGRLGGGVINLVTKSGTNTFRGTGFGFFRNSSLDSTNFFTSRAGQQGGNFKRHQFGGNVGGPVKLPRYDGKDRTFFFLNYEGLRQESASVATFSVPLVEWRAGDFSNLRAASGQPIIIYDPATTRLDPANPGQFIRDPFPGNRIPADRLSPVGLALASYWPLPNVEPLNAFTQSNNYTLAGASPNDNDRVDSRVDHVFNDRWRAFVRYSYSNDRSYPFNSFGNPASSAGGDGPTFTGTNSLSIDHSITLGPTLIVNLRYGLNRRHLDRAPLSAGFDLARLGLPPNVVATAQAAEFPRIDVQGFQPLGQNTFTDLVIAPTTHQVNVGVTRVWSTHTFKMGMDYRKFLLNFLQLFFPSGQYGFNNAQWTQRNPNVTSATEGSALASMLLGIPNTGQMSHNPTPASASSYWAWYLQDDWKVTRKLTVNLGLRYELDVPRTERFNRLSYFDLAAPSPIAGIVPPNSFFNPADLRGALVFADAERRRQVPTDLNNFGPRIGFAFNVTDRTSIRSAYGIYYMPSHVQAAGHSGSSGMMGFNSQSTMIVSLDGRVPLRTIDNPFPDGFNLPPGNSQGAATFMGLNIGGGNGGVFTTNATPFMQQWNLSIQRELPGNVIAEAAYIGSKGTKLLIGESGLAFGQVDPQYLGLGTALQDQVPNPFVGIITNPSSPLRFETVQRARLLRPFPQYDGVTAFRVPGAESIYHALTLRLDKRYANRVSLLSAYTWGKLIDDASTTVGFLGPAGAQQDAYNRAADRSISSQDIAHRFVTSVVYDLPSPRNPPQGGLWSRAGHWLRDGWQVNAIATFQSGYPLIVTQAVNNTNLFSPSQRPTWTGADPNLSGGASASKDARLQQWFDTSVFGVTPAFQFGNTPRVMSNLRADGVKNVDLSIFKNNYVRGRKWNAQLRVEVFNAFNRVQFAAPNTQVGNSNFGVVSAQANGARQIQAAVKLLF